VGGQHLVGGEEVLGEIEDLPGERSRLPAEQTLHGLRRGAAILSEATGATASETAGQLGHKNPTITTGIYMVAMKHRARLSQAERAAFAEAITWGLNGH
jgi:integrase